MKGEYKPEFNENVGTAIMYSVQDWHVCEKPGSIASGGWC